MLSITGAQRYFFYAGKTDMRRGFDSLCGLVRDEFRMDPLCGDVFVFLSRTRTRIKFLQWQGDGFAIYFKRLEKGTFELPKHSGAATQPIAPQQLLLIMEGIQLSSVKKRVRYYHPIVGNLPMKNDVCVRA